MTPQDLSGGVREANEALANGSPEGARDLLEALLRQGPFPDEAHNVITHNLLGAWRRIVGRDLERRDVIASSKALAAAMAVPVAKNAPLEMLRNRSELFLGMSNEFFEQRMWVEALQCIRRAIAIYPSPTYSNNLVNVLSITRMPSLLSDYCDTMKREQIAPHLLIACQPKSASTFLKNALCAMTGFRDLFLVHASGQSEQELFFPSLLEFAEVPSVTQQHCRASEANVQLMQAFGMRAVVLVRNLYDVLVSLRDFYTGGAVLGTFFHPESWKQMDGARRMDLLIDHVVPWHLQFYASWERAEREQRVPVMWLTYEEMMQDKPAAIRGVLAFHGLTVDEGKVAAALRDVDGPGRNRFNQGVSGRGAAALTDEQRERVRRLAAHFPETDFTRYGIV